MRAVGDEMRRLAFVVIPCWLMVACGTMTPEARLRDEIYWDAAKACESRYRTLHLDRMDTEGNLSAHADADTRHELGPFVECYRQGLRTQVEQRKREGRPLPEALNQEPTIDLD